MAGDATNPAPLPADQSNTGDADLVAAMPDYARRDYIVGRVQRGGMSLERGQQLLGADGQTRLPDGPAEKAQLALDALNRIPKANWDAATWDRAAHLGVMARGAIPLAAMPTPPDGYRFGQIHAAGLPPDMAKSLDEGMRILASDAQMTQNNARALVDEDLNSRNRERTLSPAQLQEHGDRQEAAFRKVFDDNAIAAATATIRAATGRSMDLIEIARTTGPAAVLLILHAAEDKLHARGLAGR